MIQLTNETKKDKDNKDIDDSLYLTGIDSNNLAIVRGTRILVRHSENDEWINRIFYSEKNDRVECVIDVHEVQFNTGSDFNTLEFRFHKELEKECTK